MRRGVAEIGLGSRRRVETESIGKEGTPPMGVGGIG